MNHKMKEILKNIGVMLLIICGIVGIGLLIAFFPGAVIKVLVGFVCLALLLVLYKVAAAIRDSDY